MRVFVTGSEGFVGRWLRAELEGAGHDVVGWPEAHAGTQGTDVRDADEVQRTLLDADPDAIVHLAAMSSATEAAADPGTAFAVTVGGTINLLEGARRLPRAARILVIGSSEAYGDPRSEDLPLNEDSPLRPRTTYAISKAAQEAVALSYAARYDWSVVVARSFNHTGPGQRPAFVVPALAHRVLALRDGAAPDIPVGNLDVKRDFSDVRDVARAYRQLLDALDDGRISPRGRVFNVCSGRAVTIRRIVELLCVWAGVEPRFRVDPSLVRSADPPEIRGDSRALREITSWRPQIPIEETLHDVWREVEDRAALVSVHRQPVR